MVGAAAGAGMERWFEFATDDCASRLGLVLRPDPYDFLSASLERRRIEVDNAAENIIAFRRIAPSTGKEITIVGNFSPIARENHRIGLARNAGGDDHHFRAIQLPYNLAMPEAFVLRNQKLGSVSVSLIEAASKVYGYGEELSREDLKCLAERYGPWQGYWAHYLRVGT